MIEISRDFMSRLLEREREMGISFVDAIHAAMDHSSVCGIPTMASTRTSQYISVSPEREEKRERNESIRLCLVWWTFFVFFLSFFLFWFIANSFTCLETWQVAVMFILARLSLRPDVNSLSLSLSIRWKSRLHWNRRGLRAKNLPMTNRWIDWRFQGIRPFCGFSVPSPRSQLHPA